MSVSALLGFFIKANLLLLFEFGKHCHSPLLGRNCLLITVWQSSSFITMGMSACNDWASEQKKGKEIPLHSELAKLLHSRKFKKQEQMRTHTVLSIFQTIFCLQIFLAWRILSGRVRKIMLGGKKSGTALLNNYHTDSPPKVRTANQL